MKAKLKQWLASLPTPIPPQSSITLQLRQIYIFPSKFGFVFLLFCACLLLLAINYANSLIYIICFWLVSLFLVSIFKTWQNLLGLHLYSSNSHPVFVDEKANFNITIESFSKPYYTISIALDEQEVTLNCEKKSNASGLLSVLATERGMIDLPRIKVFTTYPLGLLNAWTYLDLDQQTLCYPKPRPCPLPDGSIQDQDDDEENDSEQSIKSAGTDNFEGLERYAIGDNINRIHWPAYAKGQGLHIKEFSQSSGRDSWLDYNHFSGSQENRLEKMCYWVLKYHDEHRVFGIKLGSIHIEPSHSENHLHACLEALALFGVRP